MNTKSYLDYLEKEMNIMGILSAAAVITPAGALNIFLTEKSGSIAGSIWQQGEFFIITGSIFLTLAALYFYKQRSALAWYSGQISLCEATHVGPSAKRELKNWLKNADSWETWWPYSWGFIFLLTGFAEYLAAIFFYSIPPRSQWVASHLWQIKRLTFVGFPVIAGVWASLERFAQSRYKYSDDYWMEFRSEILRFFSGARKKPHTGVYTRLKPSTIHGIGVFAVLDIPNGTYVFEPDNDQTVSVPKEDIQGLPPEIKKMYEDFCVLEGDHYVCPDSLNRLTIAWYLNSSKNPNVAADDDLKFYAIRNIAAGEELTVDYDTYSENEASGS